ncbi:MAG: tRNA (N(6)-L-threonylcarbamoyladenosine(37)-C(2))-methylthiotransferase MtaB [Bacteroidetes bacterium]|jgi:threonylcarbamoyladenosine tRNA methylthiotransferase MtaB|nr:tRNA (N(6)-L-threonylcarbamoyladenosine(37)-C(2))-methylthiotransferase MtaB [Bacteroidota bacterium]MBT4091412.1 tRNA (N(6)-L-threonylcarbamoyladenosine(37)-C(2))-methylthiotransferase MtaB [Deltaproteobacteria bacterium]MBT4398350.1 tRNA (N(6)-L-threonylcarbamoyladenosine(37)-C(2))-methylthiotransferase MtaB [Bacteroidota bacterium]MBT5428204.1 tRNA (N(6)-L-threonylcarbamoyladenosine(37)-C(2))-methylthiotransferase MtaB [Bacteroidota bacterium]MBT7094094.1 tRNA (N(6)-L-threonylcarbamoylade
MLKGKNKTVAFYTLGCKLNFSESSQIGRQLEDEGYERIKFGESADISVIHTCSVTVSADRKTRQAIRKAKQISPDGIIVAMGCYAQLKSDDPNAFEGVDLVLGTKEKFDLAQYLEKHEEQGEKIIQACEIDLVESFSPAQSMGERTRAFLKVQDGCDYTCSYCTIPHARGKSRNPSIANLVQQVKQTLSEGISEIVLTGINTGDFGKSTNESFEELLLAFDQIQGNHRYRISSIEPNLLTDEIIQLTKESERFVPHFHIPLQAGSNDILKKMQRRYLRETFADRVYKIKNTLPDAAIGADVIVGFPGESDEHFEEAMTFLANLPLSYLHVFTYSERPGTPAAEIKTQVQNRTRDERSVLLHQLSDRMKSEFYNSQTGSIRQVIFEGRNKSGLMTGFTENYVEVCAPFDTGRIKKISMVKLLETGDGGIIRAEIIK